MTSNEKRWFGMEHAIADHLRTNGVSYIGEYRDVPVTEQWGAPTSRESIHFDFIITGAVPVFIEVKYAQFGNVNLTKALAVAAVSVFNRCRFVIVVVGPHSPVWDEVRPFVSTLAFFDLTTIPDDQIEIAARGFVTELLGEANRLPILSRSAPDQVEKWEGAQHELEADRLAYLVPSPVVQLFGQHIPQAIDVVAASFRDIVGDSETSPTVVDHELSELKREFESGHHTSCALRLGRCLELSIYAFARRLGVNPRGGQYKSILAVQNRIAELDRAMHDLASTERSLEPVEYGKKREHLTKTIIDMQNALSMLLAQLDSLDREARVVEGPDKLQAILRRVQHYLGSRGAQTDARQRLGRIIKRNQAKELLDFRNDAAHGDPDLQKREVTREAIVENLLALAEYLQELVNVVDASVQSSAD